jgi:hypothetical protein
MQSEQNQNPKRKSGLSRLIELAGTKRKYLRRQAFFVRLEAPQKWRYIFYLSYH